MTLAEIFKGLRLNRFTQGEILHSREGVTFRILSDGRLKIEAANGETRTLHLLRNPGLPQEFRNQVK